MVDNGGKSTRNAAEESMWVYDGVTGSRFGMAAPTVGVIDARCCRL